jgi:hypothetical protein
MNTLFDLSAGIVELTEDAMDLLSGGQGGGCGCCGCGCCGCCQPWCCSNDWCCNEECNENINVNAGF